MVLILTSFKEIPSQNSPVELIIAFEKYSPKLSTEFDQAVRSVPGVQIVGSCSRMNIFYFLIDHEVYRNSSEAFEALEHATKRFSPLQKVGSSISDVQKACQL